MRLAHADTMPVATLVVIVLAAGLASQWAAWQIGLPAIVVLIGLGLVLGPVTHVIEIGMPAAELTELIGLGVAIILFEGGMDLKLGEFRRVGHGIGRLTIIGPPLAWLLGSLAAHYVGGLSWPAAVILGAILVVTGPTVIGPLLRQAGLDKVSSSLLKWEGIVNDPVGVLLAVLAFQYFTVTGSLGRTLAGLGAAVGAAALGAASGWIIGRLYRRGFVAEHLKPPILMVLVLVVYEAGNLVQHEAGLLSVTAMGVVVGNVRLVERESLQRFQENLTVVLLSVLFIVIPSQLQARQLELLDLRILLFVLALMFVVRPLTIGLATVGAPMRREDRLLLGWIAPRGIVAAATAGIFGPALIAAGYPDADRLLPVTFAVIIATVLVHGLSLGRLARRLGVAARSANGLLIVGASPWAAELARALKKLGVDVLLADGSYERLKSARMEGVDVFYGEVLSEHAEHTLETQHLSHLLCATDNDFYNALVCKAKGRRFGHHRTFQLAVHQTSSEELRQLTIQQRGYFAFDAQSGFEALHERLGEGWTVQTTRLTEAHGWDALRQRMGEPGRDWLLLGGVSADGQLRLYSREQRFRLEAGWTALYFGPKVATSTKGDAAAHAAVSGSPDLEPAEGGG